jgi:hypothetical protein
MFELKQWRSHVVACGGCGPTSFLIFNFFIRNFLKMAPIYFSLKKKKKILKERLACSFENHSKAFYQIIGNHFLFFIE